MERLRNFPGFFLPVLVLLLLAGTARSEGKGKGHGKRHSEFRPEAPAVLVVFDRGESGLIRDWFWDNRNTLPPGLARRESLPPGLQKQLRRNGSLPPGLQKKLVVLPVALESRLTRLPADIIRVVIGRDLMLLNRSNNTVLDILPGVLYGPNDESQYRADRRRIEDDNRDIRRAESREPVATASRATSSPVHSTATAAGPAYSATPAPNTAGSQSFPLKVRLTRAISTATVKTGERFIATLEEPLYDNGRIVARQGAEVEGVIAEADKGGRVSGVATLTLQLARIQLQGGRYLNVNSDPVKAEANATKARDAGKIGLASGAGALIGAIAGGGKGAVIGAASGAAAGTGLVLVTRGEASELPGETVIEFNVRPS